MYLRDFVGFTYSFTISYSSNCASVPTRLAGVVPDRDRSCDHYFVYYRLWSHGCCFMQAIIGHYPGKSVYLKELSHVIVSKQAIQPRTLLNAGNNCHYPGKSLY